MKNVLFVLSGFCLALVWLVACGGADSRGLPDAMAQDGGTGFAQPANIIWLTRAYDCNEKTIHPDFDIEGFEWIEMAADRVRALHIVRKPPDGPRIALSGPWGFYDGFVAFAEACLGPDDKITMTMALEVVE